MEEEDRERGEVLRVRPMVTDGLGELREEVSILEREDTLDRHRMRTEKKASL